MSPTRQKIIMVFIGLLLINILISAVSAAPIAVNRTLPATVTAGDGINVSLAFTLDPNATITGAIIKDHVPSGWNVTSSSPTAANFNPATGEVKWVLYGNTLTTQTVNYTVSIPSEEINGDKIFFGDVRYIDADQKYSDNITGDQSIYVSGNWQYYRDITITNTGSALSDYQVLVNLTGSNFPINANSNGTDIRFTDAAGNELSYWIESWDYSGRSAKIWVKVPSIPASGGTTIRMHYGNPSASSSSSGAATFDVFEDFDMNNGEWMEYDPNNKIELDYTIDHRLEFNNWIRTDPGYVYKPYVTRDFVLEYEIAITNIGGNANTAGPGFSDILGVRNQWLNGIDNVFYAGFPTQSPRIFIEALVNGDYVWGAGAPGAHSIDISLNTVY